MFLHLFQTLIVEHILPFFFQFLGSSFYFGCQQNIYKSLNTSLISVHPLSEAPVSLRPPFLSKFSLFWFVSPGEVPPTVFSHQLCRCFCKHGNSPDNPLKGAVSEKVLCPFLSVFWYLHLLLLSKKDMKSHFLQYGNLTFGQIHSSCFTISNIKAKVNHDKSPGRLSPGPCFIIRLRHQSGIALPV